MLYDANLRMGGPAIDAQLFKLMYELIEHYGPNATCDVALSFPLPQTEQPQKQQVRIDTERGIVVGDASQGGLLLDMQILCAEDATAEKELAIELNTGLEIEIELEMVKNLTYFAKVVNPVIQNTQVIQTAFQFRYHRWDALLTSVLQVFADDFNLKHEDWKPISKFGPIIATQIKNVLVSPYVNEEFLYIGFSWIGDN